METETEPVRRREFSRGRRRDRARQEGDGQDTAETDPENKAPNKGNQLETTDTAKDLPEETKPIEDNNMSTLPTNGDRDRINDNANKLENTSAIASSKSQPIRTEPVKSLPPRQRRLDRLPAGSMPEIHIVGQISGGSGLVTSSSEGACCR